MAQQNSERYIALNKAAFFEQVKRANGLTIEFDNHSHLFAYNVMVVMLVSEFKQGNNSHRSSIPIDLDTAYKFYTHLLQHPDDVFQRFTVEQANQQNPGI